MDGREGIPAVGGYSPVEFPLASIKPKRSAARGERFPCQYLVRQAIIAARDVRAAEREAARLVNEASAAEDQAARQIVLKAEQAEHDAKAAEKAECEVASAPERKAARDARYAARKSRK